MAKVERRSPQRFRQQDERPSPKRSKFAAWLCAGSTGLRHADFIGVFHRAL